MCTCYGKTFINFQLKKYAMKFFKLLLYIFSCMPFSGYAQKGISTSADVSFTVRAPAKEISGQNSNALVEIDFRAGTVRAVVNIDSFCFQNNFTSGRMNDIIRQRFREYYMESRQYPVVDFNGKITNLKQVRYKTDGTYPVTISGILTLHGVRKNITAKAILTVQGAQTTIISDFIIEPKAYGIRLPAYIGYMYFEQVHIRISATLNMVR